MRRRAVLLLAVMAATLVMASGAAFAVTIINCPSFSGTNDCIGTNNNDRLIGTSDPDNMSALKGDDVLKGLEGDDNAMRGDQGNDRLLGGPGEDHIGGGTGKDVLKGGADFDTYFFQENNWGKETIVDTPIVDTDINTGHRVRFDGVRDNLTINLNSRAGAPEVKNESKTNTLNWSDDLIDVVSNDGMGDDTIIGRDVADNIQPSAGGTDFVNARGGNDFIYTIDGVADDIDCGDGNDTLRKDASDTNRNCETVQ
jgi:Ca2+-binding RTX toxin-like protein